MAIKIDARLNPAYLPQLEEIDLHSYGVETDPTMKPIALNFPDLYRVLRNGENVLGYTLAIPLTKKFFDAMRNGEAWEPELTLQDIDPSSDCLYLSSIASSQRIRNRLPLLSGVLVGDFAERVLSFPGKVITTPVTRTGQNLAKMVSMSPTNVKARTDLPFQVKPVVWERK